MTDNFDHLNENFGEVSLGQNITIHQAVYQEVRKIMPETELPQVAPVPQEQDKIGYILLGFKSLDRKFSQVMLDTWKDWTGARYIYMYLPDDLGLRRISLYYRQQPDDLNLFTYLVLVECHGITNGDKMVQLLDFAQRMRLERLTGYVSVYVGEKFQMADSPTPAFPVGSALDEIDLLSFPGRKTMGITNDIFNMNSIDRSSRM
ncbi:hypothetical protein RUM43_007390 [Polyplax serrata]|uniref:DUF7153 domain-containing protein n=1 Tax=Polyplax serrata TaxID=468196 RepID=A0AAN8S5F8_POLSC